MAGPVVSVDVDIREQRGAYDDLVKALLDDASHVDIGIHSISGEELVVIASANEFGATINHPGGQPYIIKDGQPTPGKKNEIALDGGTVLIFLKKGSKGMGVTKAHTIIIPARSFVRSTMDMRRNFYERQALREWNAILEGKKSTQQALAILGLLVQTDIQNTIRTLKEPENAQSTKDRKGSDNPLIDTGVLVNSIRYIVKNERGQNVEIGT